MQRRDLLAGLAAVLVAPHLAEARFFHGGGPTPTTTSKTYYVDNATGNDANNGLSAGSAWRTITKVNAGVYGAGDYIRFNSAQTFSGGVSLGVANWSSVQPPTPSAPVTIGSYIGSARATISCGSSNGVAALNIGQIVVRDLIIVGGGQNTAGVDGVRIWTNLTGSGKLDTVKCINLDVSQCGNSGIYILGFGASGSAGFTNVSITDCVTHDNCGVDLTHAAGIQFYCPAAYGQGNVTPGHTNIYVGNCKSYNNKSFGGGILVRQSKFGTVELCEAYGNGAAAAAVGIWVADAGNIVVQFCESHGNLTPTANDGDGFDLDGACFNCTLQYNYAHDNAGTGYLIYNYNDTAPYPNTMDGNVVRFNISENDGVNAGNFIASGISIGNDAGTSGQTNVAVYGNTIYSSRSGVPCIKIEGAYLANISGHVCNNILYANGVKLIDFQAGSGNPTSLLFEGNDYFSTGSFQITWNGTTYTTLAAWRSAVGKETINGGFNVNPQLTSPGGGGTVGGYAPPAPTAYALQNGSPMIGAGLDLLAHFGINPGTRDYYGTAIPSAAGFDVGAWGGEWQAVFMLLQSDQTTGIFAQ